MDGTPPTISSDDLYARIGNASAPILLDVRRRDTFESHDRVIVGALRRNPEDTPHWLTRMPVGRQVVAYCIRGGEVSQGVVTTLRKAGIDASYLTKGIAGWQDRGLPTRRKSDVAVGKWVTREHPKIDRIACPWLITRFINPEAEFLYVAPEDVQAVARVHDATPYDIKNVEFGHVGDRCSFDAIIAHFGIADPALDRLATIVRGADTSRADLAPQCEGLLAISYGLSANFPDDHAMLRHGLIIYDALYTWCRLQHEQSPRRPSKTVK